MGIGQGEGGNGSGEEDGAGWDEEGANTWFLLTLECSLWH